MAEPEPSADQKEPRYGDLLVLEGEIRLEQTGATLQRIVPGRPVYAEKAAGKGRLLASFDSRARALLGEEAYQQLAPCPSADGLLWGRYIERLHVLKVALRAKRQQLLDQRLGRG